MLSDGEEVKEGGREVGRKERTWQKVGSNCGEIEKYVNNDVDEVATDMNRCWKQTS